MVTSSPLLAAADQASARGGELFRPHADSTEVVADAVGKSPPGRPTDSGRAQLGHETLRKLLDVVEHTSLLGHCQLAPPAVDPPCYVQVQQDRMNVTNAQPLAGYESFE